MNSANGARRRTDKIGDPACLVSPRHGEVSLSRSQIFCDRPPDTDKNSILWRGGRDEHITPCCLTATNRRYRSLRDLDDGVFILAWADFLPRLLHPPTPKQGEFCDSLSPEYNSP